MDDVIYGVLLHEKLKDGLLTVGLSLPAQAKHAVRFSRFFHFHISWAVVIGSLMVVKWLPPELCHGAYIVLASCITMPGGKKVPVTHCTLDISMALSM